MALVSHIAKVLRQLNRARYTLNALAEQTIAYSLSSPGPDTPKVETRQNTSSSSQPTFAQARTSLASWSSEASRMAESIKEWLETCSIEIPSWEEVEVGKEDSEDELDIDDL